MTKYNIPFHPRYYKKKKVMKLRVPYVQVGLQPGPKTKLEDVCQSTHTNRTVCFEPATAALELILRALRLVKEVVISQRWLIQLLGVITPVNCDSVMVDIRKFF